MRTAQTLRYAGGGGGLVGSGMDMCVQQLLIPECVLNLWPHDVN